MLAVGTIANWRSEMRQRLEFTRLKRRCYELPQCVSRNSATTCLTCFANERETRCIGRITS